MDVCSPTDRSFSPISIRWTKKKLGKKKTHLPHRFFFLSLSSSLRRSICGRPINKETMRFLSSRVHLFFATWQGPLASIFPAIISSVTSRSEYIAHKSIRHGGKKRTTTTKKKKVFFPSCYDCFRSSFMAKREERRKKRKKEKKKKKRERTEEKRKIQRVSFPLLAVSKRHDLLLKPMYFFFLLGICVLLFSSPLRSSFD